MFLVCHYRLWLVKREAKPLSIYLRGFIGQCCFQSTHPLILLKRGTVTVSKRKRDECARNLRYMCTVSVILCLLGVSGVSGAVEGPLLPFCIHIYDINTNKHIQRSAVSLCMHRFLSFTSPVYVLTW